MVAQTPGWWRGRRTLSQDGRQVGEAWEGKQSREGAFLPQTGPRWQGRAHGPAHAGPPTWELCLHRQAPMPPIVQVGKLRLCAEKTSCRDTAR